MRRHPAPISPALLTLACSDVLPLFTRVLTAARLVYSLFTPNPGASADLGGGREGSSAKTLLGKLVYDINVARTAPGQEKYR